MKKKFLALVLTLAMVLSLVPATALAAGETTNGDVIVKPAESQTYPEGVDSLNKTAVKTGENTYDVTLEVNMHETTTTTSQAAATVLVIDVSNSMDWHVVCGRDEHKHTRDCYVLGWLTCGETEHTHTDACGESRLDAAKAAAENFVNTYAGSVENAGRYLSIVVFGTTASVELNWTDVSTNEGKASATSVINGISVNGGTNLEQGLAKAKEQFTDRTVASVNFKNVVALTDGAPTFYGPSGRNGRPSGGNGSNGSEEINNETAKAAENLKKVANLYTVCFGAANDYTYEDSWGSDDGPTVGEFLRDSIATGSNYAYNADNAGALNSVFEKISETITSGISAGVVHDALPTGVSSAAFGENTEADWNLSEEGGFTCNKTTNAETGRTDYIYTKTYTVTIDPEEIDPDLLEENDYYPLNGQTTLKVTVNNEEQKLNFPIPYGKVKFNTYSVTYKDGAEGAVFDDSITDNLRKGASIPAYANEGSIHRDGYTFSGWKWYQGETELTAKPDTMPAADLVAVAQWTAKTYTVTWKNGDTELEQDENVAYNTQPSYDSATPTKEGNAQYTYKFAGWSEDADATTGVTADKLPGVKKNVIYYAIFEATPQTYTVIFNANGGAWSDSSEIKTTPNLNANAKITLPDSDPGSDGKEFQGWGYYPNGMDAAPEQIPALSFRALTVERLYAVVNPTETPENTVTLYAIWKDVPQSAYTYTIHQHFMKDEKQALGAQNYIELNEVQAGTAISTLIPSDTKVEFDGRMYLYEANNTTVNNQKYQGTEKITGKNTVIDLYYYLDSWKDGDIGSGDNTDDSLTGGDGTPDYKQILIQYQVYQEGNGQVNPTFEVVTVKDNKELTAIHGSSVTKAGTGYTFVTWTGQNATVNETTVDKIVAESTKLNEKNCDPSGDTLKQGNSYTYTAIFLEDKIGGGENKDQPDGIPDAWQYKVTFKVVNGKWNNQTTADVVAYVTNKKNGTPCAKGTEGSKATLDGVTIPVAGSQPDSGYKASGNWDTTPSATTVINKEDTVFTYTYDKKSGGSGGSGGSNRPKPPVVEIPDDVPTGLNGKDHYAYVVGYPDGMVYPQKNITRAEVATIFFRLLKDETREANMTKSNSYNDMKDGAWYTCAVSTLSKMGIIKGYEDGSFKPDASISRAEFAAIAARFDPDGDKTPATFSDVSSHWAKDEISIAANHGWIKGYEDGSFKPDQKITRAETMTLVNRVLKRLPETKDDLHKDMKTWPDNQNESAWFYLAVQEATNSHYQKLKKDGTHETWESMRETRDWAALEK